MKHAHRERDLDLDFNEIESGMMSGKAAAIADWRFRKEARDFNRQIACLRASKWNREHPERRREIMKAHNAKPERRAAQNECHRRRRAAKPRETFVCAECGQTKERARKGPPPKFCGSACYQRAAYQARTPGARRIKRKSGRS